MRLLSPWRKTKDRVGRAWKTFRRALRQVTCRHRHTVQERVFVGRDPVLQARCLTCNLVARRRWPRDAQGRELAL